VIAEPFTNLREQFAAGGRMQAVDGRGTRRALELEAHWFHKDRVVLKFRGVDSISQAEQLRGVELKVARGDLARLEYGSYYVGDLVSCAVLNRGSELGSVAAVQFGAGEAPLLIVRRKQETGELLIPFAQEYLVQIDIGRRRIEMALPDRLLELDAPLTEEEKQAQRGSDRGRVPGVRSARLGKAAAKARPK
jgi:16S rRNA processing protein RimM